MHKDGCTRKCLPFRDSSDSGKSQRGMLPPRAQENQQLLQGHLLPVQKALACPEQWETAWKSSKQETLEYQVCLKRESLENLHSLGLPKAFLLPVWVLLPEQCQGSLGSPTRSHGGAKFSGTDGSRLRAHP